MLCEGPRVYLPLANIMGVVFLVLSVRSTLVDDLVEPHVTPLFEDSSRLFEGVPAEIHEEQAKGDCCSMRARMAMETHHFSVVETVLDVLQDAEELGIPLWNVAHLKSDVVPVHSVFPSSKYSIFDIPAALVET